MLLTSSIIITEDIENTLSQLRDEQSVEKLTIIKNEDNKGKLKEFLVEQAQEAIEKAYISSELDNYIILVAPRFSEIAQNRLLKLLEEPPKNKFFIIVTESKSALLDTIKSRMSVVVLDNRKRLDTLSLDVENLDLERVYKFIQANIRVSAVEAKELVEQISLEAMKSGKFILDKSTLDMFSNAIKLLEVGSPTTFVLSGLLLKLLAKRRKDGDISSR